VPVPIVATVAQAAPSPPHRTPMPIPTPDPLFAMRQAQQIPAWARKRVLHKVPVKPGLKVFALTFDDGPWPNSTRQILRILAANDVRATFFMVGQELQRRPEIAREVRDGGHAIGNHSWNHPLRPRDPVAQIQRTDALIRNVIGTNPTLFRPPYGALNNGMAQQAMKEGQAILIWSADSDDWQRPSARVIASRIVREAGPGGIALMHDGGGNRSHTVAALPLIIHTLRARGYRFVTVPELLKLRYVAPKKPAAKKAAVKQASAKRVAAGGHHASLGFAAKYRK
jgi:chitin deacetylase